MAKLEAYLPTYNIDAIQEAATSVIKNFAKYSGINGTKNWFKSLEDIADTIAKQKREQFRLEAEGWNLVFSGFSVPVPIVENDIVKYKPRDPRFVFSESNGFLSLPSERMYAERISLAIAVDTQEVYGTRIEPRPLSVVFPIEKFSNEIAIFEATDLRPLLHSS